MLKRLRFVVLMLNGDEIPFTATNVDMVAWDRDRAKHNWPGPGDAPFVWMNYLAWHNLTKTTGKLPAMTLREFEAAVDMVGSDDDDDQAADDVDPTNRDPALG